MDSRTLISDTNSEPAANKPIVMCAINNCRVPVLVDSGAECNVADETFIKSLQLNDHSVKLYAQCGKMKCANGSSITIVGVTFIPVTIGSGTMRMKFTVVNNLFPKLIIGIKTMKDEDIRIIPVNDTIMVKNEYIPFLSKTEGGLN